MKLTQEEAKKALRISMDEWEDNDTSFDDRFDELLAFVELTLIPSLAE